MSESKAARQNAEEAIHEHMKAIRDIYLAYHPDGTYLSMCIFPAKSFMTVNNAYYGRDSKNAINASWVDEDDGETRKLAEGW